MGRPEESIIASLDVGTSSVRCMIFGSKRQVLVKQQIEIKRIYPEPSWVEQDAREVIERTVECINKAVDELTSIGYGVNNVRGLGITNQRESTVVWDKHTGQPLYNAILWLDNRTADLATSLISGKGKGDRNHLQNLCGLPIHPYFSSLKLRWIIDNVPAVRDAISRKSCLFGTIDTWVLWNLTGGAQSGVHKTDVTNASRTMLMNIHTLKWDSTLIDFFGLSKELLPQICSSSEKFGEIKISNLSGVSVYGILGDQQAALVGHDCLKPGMAKNTYGTGCFLLANIGELPKLSKHGLLTTVAYQFGPNAPVVYALEGSVAIAGALVNWLIKNLQIIKKPDEINTLAATVADSGGVYFVPAFSGLLAPHWDSDARGIICGLTEYVEKAHIARAALEAVAYQTCEILDAIKQDSGISLTRLQVDGAMSKSLLLMQYQADFADITVFVPAMAEITCLGAAIAAARGANFNEFVSSPKISEAKLTESGAEEVVFRPKMTNEERLRKYGFWKEAVHRCMHWEKGHKSVVTEPEKVCKMRDVLLVLGTSAVTLAVTGLTLLAVIKAKK